MELILDFCVMYSIGVFTLLSKVWEGSLCCFAFLWTASPCYNYVVVQP